MFWFQLFFFYQLERLFLFRGHFFLCKQNETNFVALTREKWSKIYRVILCRFCFVLRAE